MTRRNCELSADIENKPKTYYSHKNIHLRELKALHTMKIEATSKFRQFLDEEIYRTVVRWNREHQKHPYHFDFHGLTRKSAEWYILDVLDMMKKNNITEARIETGRGRHSWDNRPKIKPHLMEMLNKRSRCSVDEASAPLKNPNKFQQRTTGKWKRSIEESHPGANPIKRASTQNSGEVEGQSSGDDAASGTLHDAAQARKVSHTFLIPYTNFSNFQDYLESKASGVELPTEESAKLDPKFAFGESTLIIHMCTKCRTASRILDCIDMGNGDNGLVINLCTICRALFNTQRRIKFFQHELACIKRRQIQ
ncbi:hypothetical protein CRE_19528 [Caenorhabditis remanei]|uniref:Smr domain-containing protein n=1 Tax=Caenorhabditis remanei TaxID=31234 RepID=E3NI11_CAERE|nr:hypothetical protein CRE_19528 [Caenorhabditis remanei]